MKKLGIVAVLALLGVVAAGCAGSGSKDRSVRSAAIGSSTPIAGSASMTAPAGGLFPGMAKGLPVRVDSWDLELENNSSIGSGTGGVTAGKASSHGLKISKNIDDASNALILALDKGTVIPTLTFKVGTLLTYTFNNLFVTDVQQSGDGSDGQEAVTFIYAKMTLSNAASGTPNQTIWDYAQNVGS